MEVVCFFDYFIEKEKNFLLSINSNIFQEENFKFYIEWFCYAINDYIEQNYDITQRFIDFFNNCNLNQTFFTYINNNEFRNRVIEDIAEYKLLYKKDSIYK